MTPAAALARNGPRRVDQRSGSGPVSGCATHATNAPSSPIMRIELLRHARDDVGIGTSELRLGRRAEAAQHHRDVEREARAIAPIVAGAVEVDAGGQPRHRASQRPPHQRLSRPPRGRRAPLRSRTGARAMRAIAGNSRRSPDTRTRRAVPRTHPAMAPACGPGAGATLSSHVRERAPSVDARRLSRVRGATATTSHFSASTARKRRFEHVDDARRGSAVAERRGAIERQRRAAGRVEHREGRARSYRARPATSARIRWRYPPAAPCSRAGTSSGVPRCGASSWMPPESLIDERGARERCE